MIRPIAIVVAVSLACAPISGYAGPKDPPASSYAKTATGAPNRLVWLSLKEWRETRDGRIREREQRIKAQAQTERALAGIAACRSQLSARTDNPIPECPKPSASTLWDDLTPWFVAIGFGAAFVGGVFIGTRISR